MKTIQGPSYPGPLQDALDRYNWLVFILFEPLIFIFFVRVEPRVIP